CLLCSSPGLCAISTLFLHDALPICGCVGGPGNVGDVATERASRRDGGNRQGRFHCRPTDSRTDRGGRGRCTGHRGRSTGGTRGTDRKSTRLNSSHVSISYAVFCLKK